MRNRLIICVTFLILWCSLIAQEAVPVGIVDLAELTLMENPIIRRNELTVSNAKGGYMMQKSAFDYRIFSSASFIRNSLNLFAMDPRSSLTEGNLNTKNFITSVGLTKRFRTGLSANVSINHSTLNDNFQLNRFNENVGPNINDHILSSTLSITQPLMRGRGRSIATALEQSAQFNLESSQSNLTFANSVQILEYTTAYWQYLAAHESADIYQQNELRVRKMLEVTEELVKGDIKPNGDLAQVKADLANQQRLSNVARQNLNNVRLNLGRIVGLSEEESLMIGEPTNDFPTIEQSGYREGLQIDLLRQMAHDNRKDIESTQFLKESLALQMRVANNDRKPQFDLLGALNYGGASMGNSWSDAFSPFTNSQGRDVGVEVGLRFDFPINNNLAQGAYIQSKTLFQDQEVANANLVRNVDLNVSIAVNNMENAVAILKNAQRSLDYYLEVYENEQTKFQNGLTTLLNLILFQERLTFAQLEYLQAKQQFALSIVNLRFETGTLYSSGNSDTGSATFNREVFYTIPLP